MSAKCFGRVVFVFLCLLTTVALASAATLDPMMDIQGQGLSMVSAGAGLEGGPTSVTVNIGGPVQAALLYWAGRDRPCPIVGSVCVVPFQPYKDQVLNFDGTLVTGTIIGTEFQPVSGGGPINNIAFLADVTSIVQAKGTGLKTFTIADSDATSNLFRLNGASLIVVYTAPGDTNGYRLMLLDGLDFAYGADPTPGETQVTSPVTFNHGAVAAARTAEILVVSGDGTADRPDRIDISNNPSLLNTLNSSAGGQWDHDLISVNIPAGVGSTTLQLFSEPVNQNPDSLLWEVAALRVLLPQASPEELPPGEAGDEGCTPGYWKNHTGAWAGTGLSPGQTAGSVFSLGGFPSLAGNTLLQTLQGGGGSGTTGAAKILLRAAVAALLNAAHSGVDYPRTTTQIIADVNAALASNNRNTMLALATELDRDNNGGCPL
jgi:hypothetical protein